MKSDKFVIHREATTLLSEIRRRKARSQLFEGKYVSWLICDIFCLIIERAEMIARAEILNKEEEGGIECEDDEFSYTIDQREIVANVDVASAEKV